MKPYLITALVTLVPVAQADISLGHQPAQVQDISAEAKPYLNMASDVLCVVKELAGVLEKITDTASADAAAPQVQALSTRMIELQREAEALPRPSAETERQVRANINIQEVQQTVASFIQSFIRIGMSNGYGSQALLNSLGPVMNAMPGHTPSE